jgi:hypothetical protein
MVLFGSPPEPVNPATPEDSIQSHLYLSRAEDFFRSMSVTRDNFIAVKEYDFNLQQQRSYTTNNGGIALENPTTPIWVQAMIQIQTDALKEHMTAQILPLRNDIETLQNQMMPLQNSMVNLKNQIAPLQATLVVFASTLTASKTKFKSQTKGQDPQYTG